MAATGTPIPSGSSSGQVPPFPRAPSRNQSFQRNPSRRVLFSETTTTPEMARKARNKDEDNLSDVPSKAPRALDWDASDDFKTGRRGRRLCCAWTSLIVGCLVLVLMLLAALSLSFVKGALPEFRIKSINFSRLDVSKNKEGRSLLTASVQLAINATNKNDGYDLSYSVLSVVVSSEDIGLGTTNVPALKQNPKKSTVLNVSTEVKRVVVDEGAAEELKSNNMEKQVEISVAFKGSVSLNMEGHKLNGLPLKVYCTSVSQNDIDNGLQPKCRVKLFHIL